ncbi:MAG TPA: GNAT family N-acetyltransferase [Anaerolineae bacterium]|nr:GNAT family N-acetyltransferase [Anaerolineae bacterium]
MIKTKHLHLRPVERRHVEAFLRGRAELAALLQVSLPQNWPHFPAALAVLPGSSGEAGPSGWEGYFFIQPQERVLVGNGGFKGPPDETGTVEIGYEIATEYWNRGFATEAARGLIEYAFAHPEVQSVIAHTLAEKNASTSVLQKVGMRFVAEVADPGEGTIWRWQISRAPASPA